MRTLDSRTAFVALTLASLGCAAGETRAPPARVPGAPAAPAATPSSVEPREPSATKTFAVEPTEYGFLDPERRQKLVSAFPAIDSMIDDVVRKSKIPGMTVGIVIDGELAYGKGFGVTDLSTGVRPDVDTVYRIASLTKSFTALGVLSLRDDGVLTLDDPVTRWVPEHRTKSRSSPRTRSRTARARATRLSRRSRLTEGASRWNANEACWRCERDVSG